MNAEPSEDEADEDDEYYGDDPNRCWSCGKLLSDEELDRHHGEIEDWAEKHPTPFLDDHLIAEDAGILRDCHRCAVERLRQDKRIEESRTFIERAAAGGNEGWVIAGIAFLALLLFLALTKDR